MIAFGEVSQPFRDLTKKHADGITLYAFLHGLETAAAVQAVAGLAAISRRVPTIIEATHMKRTSHGF